MRRSDSAAGGNGSATASPGTANGGASEAMRSTSSTSTAAPTSAPIAATRCSAALGFVAGHEAEIAFRDGKPRVAVQRAQHAHVRVMLDHHPQLRFVPAAAQVVEDHAGNLHVPVERLVAEDQRRDAARHAARIDDQDDRQAERLRQRGVAVAAVERQPVVEPLVALDDADVGRGGMPAECAAVLGGLRKVGIEIAAAAAGGGRQPHRVDVIRAFLERLHRQPAIAQRAAQADGDRRLARRLVGRGDEHAARVCAPAITVFPCRRRVRRHARRRRKRTAARARRRP